MIAERLRSALWFIHADDRDTWLRMGMAVKSELGEDGFDLWNQWSQQSEDYDERATRDVWRSIKANGKVTAGTLFYEAKEHGWRDNGATTSAPPPAEQIARRQRAAERAGEEAAQIKRDRAKAADRARAIWDAASPAPADNPYLARKGIQPHGLRVHDGALVVPVRADGDLVSLQFIQPDGAKKFLRGGRTAGGYAAIGRTEGARALVIAEGYATGTSIHETTGHPVAVAFHAGNLRAVAERLRSKFPDLPLIVAADDDNNTPGNPGLSKATEAARAVGGLLAVPDFGPDRPDGVTDFNDLVRCHGAEAVRACIQRAAEPAKQSDTPYGAVYRCMADIEAKPISWLWPGRIARGKVSILAGHPGLGKSQVTASMAAVITTGGLWPVDRTRAEPGNVVILSAEDEPEDTIRPRLEAAGADLSRVYILDAIRDGFNADGSETHRAFNLETDLGKLAAMLHQIGGAALIVIDPISAYLGGADSHKNAEVRALLAPLSALASQHAAAVVAVSHFNKASGSAALMRVTGSLAFVAAARAAWLVSADPDDEGRRLFLPMKNNVGPDHTGLAFRIESASISSPSGPVETSRVVWDAEAVTVSADDALAQMPDDERTALDDAREWLTVYLDAGPMPARDIYREAGQAGIAKRTLDRAKRDLRVTARKRDFASGWIWELPEDGHTKVASPSDTDLATFDETRINTSFQADQAPEGCQAVKTGDLDNLGNLGDTIEAEL
jgi:putative DNA primase/helicase